MPWYHSSLTREEAERKLYSGQQTDGKFLYVGNGVQLMRGQGLLFEIPGAKWADLSVHVGSESKYVCVHMRRGILIRQSPHSELEGLQNWRTYIEPSFCHLQAMGLGLGSRQWYGQGGC